MKSSLRFFIGVALCVLPGRVVASGFTPLTMVSAVIQASSTTSADVLLTVSPTQDLREIAVGVGDPDLRTVSYAITVTSDSGLPIASSTVVETALPVPGGTSTQLVTLRLSDARVGVRSLRIRTSITLGEQPLGRSDDRIFFSWDGLVLSPADWIDLYRGMRSFEMPADHPMNRTGKPQRVRLLNPDRPGEEP